MVFGHVERMERDRTAKRAYVRECAGSHSVGKARNKDLCEVTKEIDEKIDERVLRLFGHVQRIVKDRIAKRVYVGEYDGSHSVGRPRKEGIVTVG